MAAQLRYLSAETFHLSLLTFQLSSFVRAGLGAGRGLWLTAGVRQYGHLLAAPAPGDHVIGPFGQRLTLDKPTFAQGPRGGAHPSGVNLTAGRCRAPWSGHRAG